MRPCAIFALGIELMPVVDANGREGEIRGFKVALAWGATPEAAAKEIAQAGWNSVRKERSCEYMSAMR
jgi:hypothetical protein